MTRITLDDNKRDIVVKMAEGNPGAINAMMTILKEADSIDPQNVFGGLGTLMYLDELEIYGTDIYILFNDKCDKDVRKMLMIIRACQLGFFSDAQLKVIAHDQTRQINLTDEEWQGLDEKVCGQLKEFAKSKELTQ